jgi:hypothetical protein
MNTATFTPSRVEDLRLVTGRGRYTADWNLPGQLHAHMVRSDRAHALIRGIDTAAAKASPGVVAILTADDVKAAGYTDIPTGAPVKTADGSMQVKCAMPVLATDCVRFVGQPIAMVIADSARAARNQLRAQALVPLNLTALGQSGSDKPRPLGWQSAALTRSELTTWTRQLAGLVGAGLPLERALSALADEAEQPRQHHLVAALRAEVNAGSTFAQALGEHPREFPPVYRSVVAAGEQSGHLGEVLDRLADDLEQQQTLRAKLLAATLYPAIVSAVAII